MLDQLEGDDRLLLLRFVCSFAWIDGEVSDEERRFTRRLMARFDLPAADRMEVESWLINPPVPPDAAEVPLQHRRAFLESMRAMAFMDGKIDPAEEECLDHMRANLL